MTKSEFALFLEDLLARHDPIGLVGSGAPPDEYESEADELAIVLRYKRYDQVGEVRGVVYDVFRRWFDDLAGAPETYQKIAEEIYREIRNEDIR